MSKTTLEETVEEFKERFPCITHGCDGNGSIPISRSVARQVSDTEFVEDIEWEAEQCEYCYKIRLPAIEYFRTALTTQKEELVKEIRNLYAEVSDGALTVEEIRERLKFLTTPQN